MNLISKIMADLRTNFRHGLLLVCVLMLYRLGHAIRQSLSQYPIIRRGCLLPVYAPYAMLCHSFGCFLPFSARLGRSVEFPHGLHGVFISTKASIGDGCRIFHMVTIGSTEKGSPTVEAEVLIGAHAVIVGPIKVGAFARIGANATIRRDCQEGETCL